MTNVEILAAIETKRRKKPSVKKNAKQANAVGANSALVRPDVTKEGITDGSFIMRSGMDFIRVKSAYPMSETAHFVEAKTKAAEKDLTVKVVLITEGLGNRKNMNYYGPEAIQSAPAIFEGKPCFLDHPSEFEERDIPERRVRDKCGFFKSCRVESIGGVTACVGELIFDSSDSGQMAYQKALSAIKYRDHFPKSNSEYVGLSVNADGATDQRTMTVEGETLDVNYVTRFTDSMSCDIVTSPARGGKFLALVESAAGVNVEKNQEVMKMIVESLKAALTALQEAKHEKNSQKARAKVSEAQRRIQPLLKDAIEAAKQVSKKDTESESESESDDESEESESFPPMAKGKKSMPAKQSDESESESESDDSESESGESGEADATSLKPGHKMSKTTKVTVAHDASTDDDQAEDDEEDKSDGNEAEADESDEAKSKKEGAKEDEADESEAEEANRLAVHSLIKESGLPKDALDLDYLASIGLSEARKEIGRAKKISESVTRRVLKTLDVPSAHYGKVSESSQGQKAGNNNALFSTCLK